MELLAASILLSTILYLVDKNHLWGKFWSVAKWLCWFAAGLVGLAVLDHYHLKPLGLMAMGFYVACILLNEFINYWHGRKT